MQTEKIKILPALCLDLDGTVRRSKSGQTFIKNEEDIELIPGIKQLVDRYKLKDYLIIGISNQRGVAHGFKTPQQNDNEIHRTSALFGNKPFFKIYCALKDHKGTVHPYNYRSLCRKPNIGMLALAEYHAHKEGMVIDWDNSLFVGDRPEDEQCANNANIPFKHIDEFLKELTTIS